jgi:ATP/maltotriose-dependent transcriptional regulator MalT
LLSEWVRGTTQPVAWLSLDGGDNDPVRFWRHVLAALDMVRPGMAERLGPLAGPPAPLAYDALVSALINDVVADPGLPDVLLVLDEQLTGRELEVLAMLAAGRSNQSIASHLVISLDTVKKHVSHLLGKLGAANRTEAVARGRELGLID